MNKLKEIIKPYGKLGYIRLALYPLTTLFTTPYRLAQTLWSCRILASGKLTDYNNFSPNAAFNNLWYWTIALNFSRFGRTGRCEYIGLQNFLLSKLFSYSLPSLYAYWCSSNICVLAGMFGWWAFHLIWITPDNFLIVVLVMVLLLISTTFYNNTFSTQHYNALGWMFYSLGIYGLFTDQNELAGLAWLLSSFGSFTVAFLGGILSISKALIEWNPDPALAFLPAGIKLLTHFWPNIIQANFRQTILDVARLLGFHHRGVKYRWVGKFQLSLGKSYYALIYIQFYIAATIGGFGTELLSVGMAVFYLNSTRFRFADDQSLQILILGLATATMIQSSALWLLPFYWILISPAPLLTEFAFMKVLDVVPPLKPFHIKPFLKKMESFIEPVQAQQRILMAFDNPKGYLSNVFDGFKSHIELFRYIATQKGITVLPSWEAVLDLNYEGAPEFWGREVNEVLERANQWEIDYVLIYQRENTILDDKWLKAGFQITGEFDWKKFHELKDQPIFPKPKWWLLKIPCKN